MRTYRPIKELEGNSWGHVGHIDVEEDGVETRRLPRYEKGCQQLPFILT